MRKASSGMASLALLVALVLASGRWAWADSYPPVTGIFGLDRVDQDAAIAFWMPLAAGESLTGFSWFNNDGTVTFPQIRAVAGDCDRPELLQYATVVGGTVRGGDSAWSRYEFSTPLASTEAGLYVVLSLPAGSVCAWTGQGGGAGVGYTAGDGRRQCWFTVGDEPWDSLAGEYRMAVVCETTADKRLQALRVGRTPTEPIVDPAGPATDVPMPVRALSVHPNPFNPQVEIVFAMPQRGQVAVSVYDMRGSLIRTLCNESLEAGEHRWTWDGRDEAGRGAPSGVYFARITTGSNVQSVRMTLVQ
jgi:hypothetical protein